VRISYTNSVSGQDYSKQKHWDRELSRYRDVTAQGIQPEGTTHRDMDRAERAAEAQAKAEVQYARDADWLAS
jgi:hypothetical protein